MTPRLPLRELHTIGVIPLKEWPPGGSGAPFERQLAGRAPGSPGDFGYKVPLHSILPGFQFESSAPHSRQKLADALFYVEFGPQRALSEALWAALKDKKLGLENLYQIAISDTVRKNDTSRVPAGVDAVLDVEIIGAGYYPSKAAGGYSPMLYVRARLIAASPAGYVIEEFTYAADHRPSEGELRHLQTAAQLNVRSLDDFRARGPELRAGMIHVCAQLAQKVAFDVHRTSMAQSKL